MVTVEKDTNRISIMINDKKAVVNGKELLLDYPAILYKDLTYVPLRFIAENLGGSVVYSEKLGSDYTYYYDTQMPVSPAAKELITMGYINVYDFGGIIDWPHEIVKE